MANTVNRGRKPEPGQMAVVVGAGRSGRAAARLLCELGVRTRLLDSNANALNTPQVKELENLGVEICPGEHNSAQFAGAAFVVPSPGMPIASLDKYLKDTLDKPEVISEMELAWRMLDDEPVLAITGTSGKTTTASLAAAMLEAQGFSVFLGGNIGTPLCEYVLAGKKADAIVVEISSFQLQGCSTFHPHVAVLLNISPNHLDYHKDMAEYVEAKFRLFRCQTSADLAVLGSGLKEYVAEHPLAAQKVCIEDRKRFTEMKLLGKHNALNAEAAWQATSFLGVSLDNARRAVAAFAPLPHRLEIVRELNGVRYINDSKCTTVAALKVALEAVDKPVRLLCGGKFKGGDLAALAGLVREKAAEVILFGASREYFEKVWQGIVPVSWYATLKEAMQHANRQAVPGDTVLLAPATSSFDLYKNYCERGDDFRHIAGEFK